MPEHDDFIADDFQPDNDNHEALYAARREGLAADAKAQQYPSSYSEAIPQFVRGVTKSVASLPVSVADLALSGTERARDALAGPYNPDLPHVPQVPEWMKYATEPTNPGEQAGNVAGNIGMIAAPVVGAGGALIRKFATGAAPGDVAAINYISKMKNPRRPMASTAPLFGSVEADATAQRIAGDALQRGSVPEARNWAVRNHMVFNNLKNSEAELEAAKMSIPPGQRVDGRTLIQQIENEMGQNRVAAASRPQYGPQMVGPQGGPYAQVTGYQQGQDVVGGRYAGLERVKNQVSALMDNNGSIPREKLQDLKELIDKDIYDHGGWKDTGSAADRSNLQALRQGNGYIRDSLDKLGNTRLNAANEAYSHNRDLAKIVEIQNPDLEGLATTDAKAARSLTPLRGSPAQTIVRSAVRHPFLTTGGVLGGAEATHELLKYLGH